MVLKGALFGICNEFNSLATKRRFVQLRFLWKLHFEVERGFAVSLNNHLAFRNRLDKNPE
jgi:hypothetical protein